MRLALQGKKYRSINVKAPFLRELLDAHPTLSVVFAAAGFRFDCCEDCDTGVSVAAFRFTSEKKTEKMIHILSGPVFVEPIVPVDA